MNKVLVRIWGIRCAQARKHTSEGIHPGFETQGRRHKKSKTGVSVAQKKDLCPTKILKKLLSSAMLFSFPNYYKIIKLMQ